MHVFVHKIKTTSLSFFGARSDLREEKKVHTKGRWCQLWVLAGVILSKQGRDSSRSRQITRPTAGSSSRINFHMCSETPNKESDLELQEQLLLCS